MFAILQFTEPESKLSNIFGKVKIESERVNLPSGDSFFIVRAEKRRGKIPWKRLESCLGILRSDVILPDGVTVPEDVNITAFMPKLLPRFLLMNSSADYLVEHESDFIFGSLTVYDEMGIYLGYIERLLHCFSAIKIVTQKREVYEKLSCELLKKYGFSLMVTEKETFDSDAVISHCCNVPIYFGGTVFTNEKKYLMNTKAVSGSEILLPPLYENLRPHNVGRVLFASALYEKCAVAELKELKYEDFGC
ncbi:MAG: hypothetical protein IJW86_05515 [Clostridia bacterium]|nr:hypothetical protein [Clostridia bacterium]